MALIKCKECGIEISTMAKVCPKCGAPASSGKFEAFALGLSKMGFGTIFSLALLYAWVQYKFFPDEPSKTGQSQYTGSLEQHSTSSPQSANSPKSVALAALEIKKLDWHKGGFDNVMLVNVKFQNNGKRDVKDIELECVHFSNSRTRIDSNKKIIFEVVPAGKSLAVKEFSMGFIHSQAVSTNCKVTDAVVM